MMKIINTNLNYKNPLIPLDLNKVEYVFIHHIDARIATVEDIHKWHLNNGWNGFGYNEYIRKDGTVYIGRGDHIGAHCQGYNSKSYGIACEGNYEFEKDMPQAQFDSLVTRVKHHVSRLPKGDSIKVMPHSQYFKTSCPGRFFPMAKLYEELSKKDEVSPNTEHEELFKFLLHYGMPIERIALAERLKEIIENTFEAGNLTRDQLRSIFKRRG